AIRQSFLSDCALHIAVDLSLVGLMFFVKDLHPIGNSPGKYDHLNNTSYFQLVMGQIQKIPSHFPGQVEVKSKCKYQPICDDEKPGKDIQPETIHSDNPVKTKHRQAGNFTREEKVKSSSEKM